MDTFATTTAAHPREPGSVVTHASSPRPDGRNRRKDRSRAAILQACRRSMCMGELRPTAAAIAKQAGVSVRTVFDVFNGGGIDNLWREALDEPTKRAILALVLRDSLFPASAADCDRVVRAIVFGRG